MTNKKFFNRLASLFQRVMDNQARDEARQAEREAHMTRKDMIASLKALGVKSPTTLVRNLNRRKRTQK